MQSLIEEITAGNAKQIYLKLLETVTYTKPHEFIRDTYAAYKKGDTTSSTNGKIFEYLICETLAQSDLVPFYFQAKMAFVPNCDFDIVLFHSRHPVALSAKVSLRERYKQAVLEGINLRQVHRGARQYLITLSATEAATNIPKIAAGDITGLEDIVVASTPKYDDLLKKLKTKKYEKSTSVESVTGKIFPKP